ncbi:MAG: sigma factor-like helix-turn-helix DNA-binding protein, partial [bacterium]
MASATITFKPKQVTKRLLAVLPTRSRDVIINRYGLGKSTERMTLDGIGKMYKITRERVRQIENHALALMRKAKQYTEEKP